MDTRTRNDQDSNPKSCRLCGRTQAVGYPHSRCPEGKCAVITEPHLYPKPWRPEA